MVRSRTRWLITSPTFRRATERTRRHSTGWSHPHTGIRLITVHLLSESLDSQSDYTGNYDRTLDDRLDISDRMDAPEDLIVIRLT